MPDHAQLQTFRFYLYIPGHIDPPFRQADPPEVILIPAY